MYPKLGLGPHVLVGVSLQCALSAFAQSQPPSNDSCQSAIQLSVPATVQGSTTYATLDGAMSSCGASDSRDAPDVWYTVSGTGGALVLCTCGSSYDTQIAVYTGNCGSLTCVGGADGAFCPTGPASGQWDWGPSRFSWCSSLGTTYLIRVFGYYGEVGDFTLDVLDDGPLTNDNCPDAIAINELPANILGSTSCAAPNEGGVVFIPTCSGNDESFAPGVWYKLVGTDDLITATVYGSSYKTQIAVYTGACDDEEGLQCVGGSSSYFQGFPYHYCWSRFSWKGTADTTYLIYVMGIDTGAYYPSVGEFMLNVTNDGSAPSNDSCQSAIEVSLPASIASWTTDAAWDESVPYCDGNNGWEGRGLWYKVVGTGNALTASTCLGSSYDTQIAVFTGACDNLACVAGSNNYCSDCQSPFSTCSWCSSENQTYLVRVYGYYGDRGAFGLDIFEEGGTPDNDEPGNPADVGTLPASVEGSTACASWDDTPVCGGNNGSGLADVWYTVAGTGNAITASTCGSAYDTQLAVYYDDSGTLTCVGGADGGTCPDGGYFDWGPMRLRWCSHAGVTYLIRVFGFGGSRGDFTLDVSDDGVPCQSGACCFTDGSCEELTVTACAQRNGTYPGDETTCMAHACEPTINPPPIYDLWDGYEYGADSCGDGFGDGLLSPGLWPVPGCDNNRCCYCWKTFSTWYYQDWAPLGGSLCNAYVALEQAPLYLPDFGAWYTCESPALSSLPQYRAHFQAMEGVRCLKSIPLDRSQTPRPATASAYYQIVVGGEPFSSSDSYWGALFWVTAVYDETVFDVRLYGPVCNDDGWGWWYYRAADPLGSFQSRLFQQQKIDPGWATPHRQSEWRAVPDCVEVRLRSGRTLEDVRGRTVRLLLHSLNWAGSNDGCDEAMPRYGDLIYFEATDDLDVGVCADVSTEDWSIEPPALGDECAAPNLPEAVQKAAELESLGTRVVNDLNVDLPALRVGHNRWKAARTLGETLGNDAYWQGGYLMFVNVAGVWCCVNDVPGWWWDADWQYYPDVEPFAFDSGKAFWYARLHDEGSGLIYWYVTTGSQDGAQMYPHGKLRYVQDGSGTRGSGAQYSQREYRYQGDDITLNLVAQCDSADPSVRIHYAYATAGDQLELTVTGHSLTDGERTAQARFGPPLLTGGADRTRPLVEATLTAGGAATRSYEWYSDRRLKSVSDVAGNVLAEFTYDGQGRLIKRTRGSVGMGNLQTVAEFVYVPPEPPEKAKMTARFYMDATNYQCAVRTFSDRNEVVSLAEYEELGTGGEVPSGTVATTNFNYHTPDAQHSTPETMDPFYHRVMGCEGDPQVVLSRCLQETLPSGLVSQYTFFNSNAWQCFDYGFHPVESYLHLSPDLTTDPPEAEKIQHTTQAWRDWQAWDLWEVSQQRDVSRNGDLYYGYTGLEYDDWGFLIARRGPELTVGVNTGFRAEYERAYDSKHRIVQERRKDGEGNWIQTDYAYDRYNGLRSRTENPGDEQRQWRYVYNVFGEEVQQTDPDGFVTIQHRNAAGLLDDVYTYTGGASGPVIRETVYTYDDGRVKTVKVALNDGPFALGDPADWVTTTYDYDNYGRLTTKTVTPGDYVTSYEYDVQDRIKRITFPDGIWKEWIRNGRGYVVETHIGTGPDPVLVSTYHYDLNGNLDERTCQGCPDCPAQTTYEYDEFNRRTAEVRVK
jgi:YD repeat-containing protein